MEPTGPLIPRIAASAIGRVTVVQGGRKFGLMQICQRSPGRIESERIVKGELKVARAPVTRWL